MTIEELKKQVDDTHILPLTNDIIFKYVFINNKTVLVKMLKDIFKDEMMKIDMDKFDVSSGYETIPSMVDGKLYRGDIYVKMSDYSYALIEMNNMSDPSILERNLVNLVRIQNQVLKQGTEDQVLKYYRLKGLNLNNFNDGTLSPVKKSAICDIETGEVDSSIYEICNIYLEKCRKLVYDRDVRELPKEIRWGAILIENDIEVISKTLGEDMLSMEEKENLLNTMKEVSNNEGIYTEYLAREFSKLKEVNQLYHAREEGHKLGQAEGASSKELEVIKNMLKKSIDYSTISEVTGKTIEEIKEIENILVDEE